jgi:fucose 4-O-acetylase-like acetyltransferase
MSQHVTVLVSFIFAIALTHVFSSASQLILARERVRFSWLLSVSMLNAALGVIINWLSFWQLRNFKDWSFTEVVLQLGWVIPNYFSCSLVAMPYSESGLLDMAAFFERQRRVIFSATLALWAMSSVTTYLDRNNFEGWKPNDWIGAEVYGLPLGVCAVLAGWSKPRWLQWVGVGGQFVQNIAYFFLFTLGS